MAVQTCLGRHILVEMRGCNSDKLSNKDLIDETMSNAALEAGATIIGKVFYQTPRNGVSGIVVIAESHLSIHTNPQDGSAAIDLFTCGETVDPWKAFNFLSEILEANETQAEEFMRGQFEQKVAHKPGAD